MNLRIQSDVRRSLDQARALLRVDRPDEALPHIMDARRLDPDDVEAMLLAARVQLMLRRPVDAMTSLDAASLHDHRDEHAMDRQALRAQALAALNRHEEAARLLKPLLKACPDDARLHRLIAAALEKAGRTDEAVTHLRRVIELEPSDASAARHLARLIAADDPQSSIDLIQRDAAGFDAASRWQTAQWMKQAGRLRDAEETYRRLLEERPEDAALWCEAAAHADSLGESDVAVARYARSIALSRDEAVQARTGLARTYMHAGRFAQAAVTWWRLARLQRDHLEAWAGLIVSAHCSGRPHLVDLASRRFERLTDEDDRTFLLAESWMDASAGEVIQRLTQPAPENEAPTASPLTWILQRSSEVLSAQVVRRPGWADTLYHTAVCEAALGDEDAARLHVQAALDINPNYKAATTLAAQLPKAA